MITMKLKCDYDETKMKSSKQMFIYDYDFTTNY